MYGIFEGVLSIKIFKNERTTKISGGNKKNS